MSVIDLNLEHLRKLMIDGLDHLSNAIEEGALLWRKLYFLVRLGRVTDECGCRQRVRQLWRR